MSKSWTKETDFTCSQDCRQGGCPGHKFRLLLNHTSNFVSILIDEREVETISMDVLEETIKHWND